MTSRRHTGRAFTTLAGLTATALAVGGVLPVAAVPVADAQTASPLYFSEYVEGTSNNKAVEIHNPSDHPVDLTGHTVKVYFNGSTNSTNYALTGTVPAGGVFTFGSSSASFAARLDQSTGASLWNGDDAIVLAQGQAVLDSIGQVGVDPGTAWGIGATTTLDHTLRRTAHPDTDPTDAFDPAAQWAGAAVDDFSDLGLPPTGTGPVPSTTPVTSGPTTEPSTTQPSPTQPSSTQPSPTAPAGSCTGDVTSIGSVQGTADTSAKNGQTVTVRGVVVGAFQQGGLNGYHLQDTGDGDDATSDGIFVYDKASTARVGDQVQVTGTVSEFKGLTQITPKTSVTCTTGQPLPAPVPVQLPFTARAALERYEGMRITLPQALPIIEDFNYDRYGTVVVSSARQYQPTQLHAPGSPEASALAEANARDRLVVDDGRGVQNPSPALHPDGTPFTMDHRFRTGDTLAGLTGVLDYRNADWALQPTEKARYAEANPRPATPAVGGSLKVASANVLNYFTTLTSQNPNARGADNAEEFERQKAKIVSELTSLDADVFGLMELENGGPALADLVAALNARAGAGTYAYVDTGKVGGDAIQVGLVYKPATVNPKGAHRILDSTVDPRFVDTKNRPSLAQVFTDKASGRDLTVVVNHLKSKGSDCNDLGDPLAGLQGNCNGTRTKAAQALVDWVSGDPELGAGGNALLLGDFNAYDHEDPVTAMTAAGYTDLSAARHGDTEYSYLFDGQLGSLDHAMASPGLASKVVDAREWHNNADEPDILDYDTSFKAPAEDALYAPDAYRASDHDPILVGLDLGSAPTTQPTTTESPTTEPVTSVPATTDVTTAPSTSVTTTVPPTTVTTVTSSTQPPTSVPGTSVPATTPVTSTPPTSKTSTAAPTTPSTPRPCPVRPWWILPFIWKWFVRC